MDEQRERARRDAAAKREVVALSDLPAMRSEFTGYDEGSEPTARSSRCSRTGRPSQSLSAGEEGTLDSRPHVVLCRARRPDRRSRDDRSREGAARFEVRDTQYMGDAIAHHGVVLEGEIRRRRARAHERLGTMAARDSPPPHVGASAAARAQGRARRRRQSGRLVGRASIACASTFAGRAAR